MNKISCIICGEKNRLQSQFLNTIESVINKENIHFISKRINTNICNTNNLEFISNKTSDEYVLLITNAEKIDLIRQGIYRFHQLAEMSGADMLYSDFNDLKEGNLTLHPLTDHHEGCVRNDFNLGEIIFIKASALKNALSKMDKGLKFGAFYALRLELMKNHKIERIPEPLYTVINEEEKVKTGEAIFEYVNPANREVQVEMEQIFTSYLKEIGAFLKPKFRKINLADEVFKTEASVIIPVKDRAETIKDAIESVIAQECDFPYNIIVVDNHSTDGTTKIIEKLAHKNKNIIHLLPESKILGIGGCWNLALNHHLCGRFAIQLDSDDVYNTPHTIKKIVKCFYENSSAMVIGSYQMMNFDNEPIAPGIIDHNEWTDNNGSNNALRINGLGAPRAFYTPIIRDLQLPNTSYGEDYAVGLALSRRYHVGRIYTPVYNCRRWEGNSDANLDINKMNRYNEYKDKIRYFEIKKRILINK